MLPWFKYSTIQLGPVAIQVWGLFVALGVLLSFFIIHRLNIKDRARYVLLADLVIWMLVGGFIGARIFHVFFYEPVFYLQNVVQVLAIWHGGLSSFGGIFGAIVAFFIFAKRKKIDKSKWLGLLDNLSYAAIFGWIVGRVGCVMIHDHMGRPCNCFLAIQTPDGVPRLEMALLEILCLLPLAFIFFIYRKRKFTEGFYFYLLITYYGFVRFGLDFFRAVDIVNADTRYFGLTPAQYFSILLILFGARFFFFQKSKTGRFA